MKLVKSLLLGSAAGIAAAAGAQAADLPVRKAAPVEYVRICSAYGAGFFYIPGTDTCLRVGGRARFEYQYSDQSTRSGGGGNVSGYRTLGRLSLDARTQTAYGTLRTFVRVDVASRTGQYLFSGSGLRSAQSFQAQGIDTQQAQKFIELDKAYVQFAGFTAGRAASLFDFYAHDFELIGSSLGSDQSTTNQFAYTATLGNGFSASIAAEDPTFRRTPVFNVGAVTGAGVVTSFGTVTSPTASAPVFGNAGIGFVDVSQKNRMPDVIGNLRYDAPWGSAQLSAAVHEIAVGNFPLANNANNIAVPAGLAGGFAARRPSNEYGFSVQGGIKVNTPFISAGDSFYLQGAYGQGAQNYAGISSWAGFDTPTTSVRSALTVTNVDAVVNPFTARTTLSDAFTVVGSYLHYWTPEYRSAFFGSYGEMHYPRGARAAYAATGNFFPTGILPLNSVANINAFNVNPTLRDWNIVYVGANLIWSPVRDLDIGAEGVYQRLSIQRGRVSDLNTFNNAGAVAGIPVRTRAVDDNFLLRFRVQRDF